MHIVPEFAAVIAYMDMNFLSTSRDVVCIVDRDLKLVGYNDSWINFAKANDGETVLTKFPLQAKISNAGEGQARDYILHGYERALRDNKPFEHQYECSSPEKYRVFYQTAYPIADSKGLVITHHLVVEKDHDESEETFFNRLEDSHDFLTQCANCRKIRHPQEKSIWLWVPALVRCRLPNVSHSICPPCLDHYYPDITD
jgi:hypothetical protein